MQPVILIHFGELVLKGKNRPCFEKQLSANIKIALIKAGQFNFAIRRLYGRFEITTTGRDFFLDQDKNDIKQRLQAVAGIATFFFAHKVKGEYAAIEKSVLELLKDRKYTTFAVRARRVDKKFPMRSAEVNQTLGARILEKYGGKVDLDQPELEIFILITSASTYISCEKYKGAGGLPTGVSGKIVGLLSSGIDSPVACYLMRRRGAQIIYTHFHSYPLTSRASIDTVQEIVRHLQQYQPKTELQLVPLVEIQKAIVANAPARLRVILYRRAMLEIAQRIANQSNATALVTGESLGQVASQTIANIAAASAGIALPIFRPLIGWDKEEIIHIAREIGTYNFSIRPVEDCCSLLMPKQVETQAKIEAINEAMHNLEWEQLLATALSARAVLAV